MKRRNRRCSYCDAGGKHPLNIAREDVDFDIELSSGCEIAEGRVLRGMGDDIDREMVSPSSASRTSLTVSDTPSSAIEPLAAIIGAEVARAR